MSKYKQSQLKFDVWNFKERFKNWPWLWAKSLPENKSHYALSTGWTGQFGSKLHLKYAQLKNKSLLDDLFILHEHDWCFFNACAVTVFDPTSLCFLFLLSSNARYNLCSFIRKWDFYVLLNILYNLPQFICIHFFSPEK